MPVESDALADLCHEVAAEAANAILAVGRTSLNVRKKSSPLDLVTRADERASDVIRSILCRERPNDSLLCEEGGLHSRPGEVLWVVDPLDGTENFVRGSPRFAVSIAAMTRDGCLGAVIHEPASGEILDLASLLAAVPLTSSVDATSVAVAIPHDAIGREVAQAVIEHVATDWRIDRTGAAACDLLRVARGDVGAHVSVGLPPWDVAAGHELVRASGGVVIDVRVRRGGVLAIAGEPLLAEQLAIKLADYLGPDAEVSTRAVGCDPLLLACVPFTATGARAD